MRTFDPKIKTGVALGLASLAALSLSQPASAARTKSPQDLWPWLDRGGAALPHQRF